MKKLFITALCLSASFVTYANDTHITTLTSTNISMLYIHTTQQATESIRNIAVIEVSNNAVLLPADANGRCDSGLWLNAEKDSATYSMLLTAIAAAKDINIHYSENASPWGNRYYCEILRVGIK